MSDLLDLTATHNIYRTEHINAIKEIIELLRHNLGFMGNLEDLKQIEENLGLYKRNIEDDENETRNKDSKISETINEIHNHRLDVDKSRHARSDNECANLNIADARVA